MVDVSLKNFGDISTARHINVACVKRSPLIRRAVRFVEKAGVEKAWVEKVRVEKVRVEKVRIEKVRR